MANTSNFKSTLGNLCTPAQLYLALSIIALIIFAFNSFSLGTIIVKIIFIAIWTFLLNWICSKGYTTISWILVVVPIIIVILMFFMAMDVANKAAKQHVAASQTQLNVSQNGMPPAVVKPEVVRQTDIIVQKQPTVIREEEVVRQPLAVGTIAYAPI